MNRAAGLPKWYILGTPSLKDKFTQKLKFYYLVNLIPKSDDLLSSVEQQHILQNSFFNLHFWVNCPCVFLCKSSFWLIVLQSASFSPSFISPLFFLCVMSFILPSSSLLPLSLSALFLSLRHSFCLPLGAFSGGLCLTQFPWWSRAHWKESSASWTTYLAPSATTTLCPPFPASTALRNRSMASLFTQLCLVPHSFPLSACLFPLFSPSFSLSGWLKHT